MTEKNKFPEIDLFKDEYIKEYQYILSWMKKTVSNIHKTEYRKIASKNPMLKKGYDDLLKRFPKGEKLDLYSLGFEDFFLVSDLLLRDKLLPDEYEDLSESFNAFLSGVFKLIIFNNGKINNIYKSFPENMKSFFNSYSKILTTNYDNNIENFIGLQVYHLHGAFDRKDSQLDLTDKNKYDYLNSNCLMSFSGFAKRAKNQKTNRINKAVEKMSIGNNYERLKKEAKYNEKAMNALDFIENKYSSENYNDYDMLLNIEDEVDIIGLNPMNDNHIFNDIDDNENIYKVRYFYYSEESLKKAKNIFKNTIVEGKSVKKLWDSFA